MLRFAQHFEDSSLSMTFKAQFIPVRSIGLIRGATTATNTKRDGQRLLENGCDAYQFRLWQLEPEALAYLRRPALNW
jgi:hypothetical protein